MHTTKSFPKKLKIGLNRSTFFQVSLICLASAVSSLSYATDTTSYSADHASHDSMNQHLKEHGGQIYQVSNLETAWLLDEDGQGALSTELNSMIGTDENRLFFLAHVNKAESSDAHYDVSALYSRKISDFWDAQAGLRYREDRDLSDGDTVDAMFGLYGLAPYFFETEAYAYLGEDDYLALGLEFEREFLWTQKLISQPYLEMNIVLSDDSKYASKSGLSELAVGVQTRYEITKRVKPFIDVGYAYEKGQKQTNWQAETTSEKGWQYGVGLALMF
ncbi:copper resistance protein B [Acinetobacter marinus]|uniref:Copper resistance protein B n=2 Tax=Acinetobacter marinus TaxID=281375 RepID=A0A1G6GYL1_9GAMM|nr:copper resistance protein B [Acinetobacter marinus]SDB87150.1 copper resistance protein B [Acinetobacter marinus]